MKSTVVLVVLCLMMVLPPALASLPAPDDPAGTACQPPMPRAVSGDDGTGASLPAYVLQSGHPAAAAQTGPAHPAPPAAGMAAAGSIAEGGADGRLVIISNSSAIILGLGTFSSALKAFPDPRLHSEGLPIGVVQNGVPVDITGQLVDGNYTELFLGGTGAAMKNHGIANIIQTVNWEFNGEPQPPLTLAWRNPADPNDTDINGTFLITQWVPSVPKAGLYPMTFWFDGAELNIGGTNYAIYPPCRRTFWVAVQFGVDLTVEVQPQPALAGTNITISGTAKGRDAVALDNEGLLVTFDGTRIGAPLPAGWYIDDVTVTADTLHTVLKENFETSSSGWTHGGLGDDWEFGIPSSPIGPTGANSGLRCAATNLRGSYQQLADCVLQSPDFNLSLAFSASLSYYEWFDIAKQDSLFISLEALIAGVYVESDPIEINGSQTYWSQRTLDFGQFTRDGKPFPAIGSEKVHIKYRLTSRTFSVYTKGGEYSFRWEVPLETTPGEHNITVSHPASLLYASGSASATFPVRREVHFRFLAGPVAHIAYRSSADNSIQKFIELKAKMVDGKGEPPLMQIKDDKGEAIRQEYQVKVYWDSTPLDPRDQPFTVGTARPVNMSEERWDGSLTIAYRVPNEQPLGPVNVIFSFLGTRYYAASEEVDQYTVMAHTLIEPPPIEERTVFRGIDVTLYGTLRIKPEESQLDTQGGDPVVLKDMRLFWAGTEETSETKKVITELDGSFSMKYHVASTHSLGAVPVRFQFDGSDLHQPTAVDINYSVKSQTFIFFENQTVMKGVPIDVYVDGVKRLGIAGVLRDDKGDRIGGVPIALKRQRLGTEETLKSNLITGSDGVFVFPYTVRFEDQVGSLTLIASYAGDDRYTPSQNLTNYTVRVRTTIERIDLQNEVTRGGSLDIQALLYEDWNGAPGYEIKYEIMTIYLDGQPITNNMTDNGGQVSFHSIISSKTQVGIREISLDYNGSASYLPTSNATTIFVKGRTLIGFEDVFPNETLKQKHRLSGRVRLVDDAFTPLQNQTIKIFYTLEKSDIDMENPQIEMMKPDKQIALGNTDLSGYFNFNATFTLGENREGEDQWWKIHLWAVYNGRPVLMPDGEIKTDYINSTGEKTVRYYIPMRPELPPTAWVVVLATVAAISIVMGYAFYEISRRRALHGIQTIIRRAADQLVAGNEYAAVIFKAYRRLAANMKRYGYMRRDSETFREFEKAIRIALPIDQKAMNDFLTVLEEARYSQHEMGEADRGRAINALRAVQYSLEKVILTQEQLAILADKAGALPDEAEPEIYVTSADGQKRVVNVDVPTAEATAVAPAQARAPEKPPG
jgi:hypothetical protein